MASTVVCAVTHTPVSRWTRARRLRGWYSSARPANEDEDQGSQFEGGAPSDHEVDDRVESKFEVPNVAIGGQPFASDEEPNLDPSSDPTTTSSDDERKVDPSADMKRDPQAAFNETPPREAVVVNALRFVEEQMPTGTESASTRVMGLFRRILENNNADEELIQSIPKDFQRVKTVLKLYFLKLNERHGCVHDHYLFPTDPDVTHCPVVRAGEVCGEPRYKVNSTVARRAAFYVTIKAWLRDLLSIPLIRGLFAANWSSNHLRDWRTGGVYQTDVLPFLSSKNVSSSQVAFLCGSTDAVQTSRWPLTNVLPFVLQLLNIPSWARSHVSMLFLCGVVPKNCKNPALYLEPVAEELAELSPGRDGLTLKFTELGRAVAKQYFAMLSCCLNDLRGMFVATAQTQAPALTMACSDCTIQGLRVSVYGTTVYPGSVRWLSQDHPLRAEYQTEFEDWKELSAFAHAPMPPRITDEYVMASMRVAAACDLPWSSTVHPGHALGFKGWSIFAKHLEYWKPQRMILRDISHARLNLMRDLANLWGGTGNMNMSLKRIRFENARGRFTGFAPTRHVRDGKVRYRMRRPPWKATRAELDLVDNIGALVRLPQGLQFPRFFSDTLTFAHAALFFNGVGELLLELLPSIAPPQRKASLDIIRAVGTTYRGHYAPTELPVLHQQMAGALTLAEIRFPLVFNTMSHHGFLEEYQPEHGRVARFGASKYLKMEVWERFNKLIRAWAKSHKHTTKSVINSFLQYYLLQTTRVRFPQLLNVASPFGKYDSTFSPERFPPPRLTGKTKFVSLAAEDRELLHLFFLEACPVYKSAFAKYGEAVSLGLVPPAAMDKPSLWLGGSLTSHERESLGGQPLLIERGKKMAFGGLIEYSQWNKRHKYDSSQMWVSWRDAHDNKQSSLARARYFVQCAACLHPECEPQVLARVEWFKQDAKGHFSLNPNSNDNKTFGFVSARDIQPVSVFLLAKQMWQLRPGDFQRRSRLQERGPYHVVTLDHTFWN